jgi:hypothetical protein
MWTKSASKRQDLQLNGSGFGASRSGDLADLLSWPDGHTLLLVPANDRLSFSTCFYGQHSGTVLVSTDPEHWHKVVGEFGLVWTIVPALQVAVGPKQLEQFVAHKQRVCRDPDLGALEDSLEAKRRSTDS